MNRLEKFKDLMTSPWYSKLFSKLKKEEQKLLGEIINKNSQMSKEEFRKLTRTVFVENKPKNWLIIEEIVTICNDSCNQ